MKQTSSRPVSVSGPSSSGPWRVRLVPRPASRFSVCGSEGVLGPPHGASFCPVWSELSLCTGVLALQQGGQRGGGGPLQAARHLLGLACPPVPDTHPPFRRTQGPPYCMFRPRPAAGQGEDVFSAPTCPSSCSSRSRRHRASPSCLAPPPTSPVTLLPWLFLLGAGQGREGKRHASCPEDPGSPSPQPRPARTPISMPAAPGPQGPGLPRESNAS